MLLLQAKEPKRLPANYQKLRERHGTDSPSPPIEETTLPTPRFWTSRSSELGENKFLLLFGLGFLITYLLNLWLHWVSATHGLSLVGANGGSAPAAVCGLLLLKSWAPGHVGFNSGSTWAQVSLSMWNPPEPGIQPCSLHWQAVSPPLDHQERK